MASSSFETLILTVSKKVGLIVLNRPKKFNAFSERQYLEFADALKQCDADKNVNVIVVTGNGKYFSSGNDLGEFAGKIAGKGSIKDEAETAGTLLDHFTSSIIDTRKPIICGVNGPAIGIAVTMLGMMDIVYCTTNATFHTPFSALGQSPEGLSSLTFIEKMGLSNASEVLLLGKKLSAEEAARNRLVSDIWETEGFRERLLSVAQQMARYPTNGLCKVKALIRSPYTQLWQDTKDKEIALLVERWQSKECKQAIMQFMMRKASKRSKM